MFSVIGNNCTREIGRHVQRLRNECPLRTGIFIKENVLHENVVQAVELRICCFHSITIGRMLMCGKALPTAFPTGWKIQSSLLIVSFMNSAQPRGHAQPLGSFLALGLPFLFSKLRKIEPIGEFAKNSSSYRSSVKHNMPSVFACVQQN